MTLRHSLVLPALGALLLLPLTACGDDGGTETAAQPTTTASAAASASASTRPSGTTPPVAAAGQTTCTWNNNGQPPARPVQPPPTTVSTTPETATMTTGQGVIAWTLLADKAPCASASMASLATQKWYDDTPCHRLTGLSIFVLQCGDPTGTGTGGPGYQFAEENLTGAAYPRGTLAMAKTPAPGSSSGQFFLVYKDSPLPPQYTVFGKITKGLDVLDKVAAAGSSPEGDGAPVLPVQITTLTVAQG